jgi:hypothetical protein
MMDAEDVRPGMVSDQVETAGLTVVSNELELAQYGGRWRRITFSNGKIMKVTPGTSVAIRHPGESSH